MSVCEQRGGGEERKCSIIQEATGGSTWPCSRENKGSDPHCVFTFHDNTAHPQAYIAEERNGQMVFTGNRTECALLLLTRAWGLDFRDIREEMDERLHQVGGQAGVGTSGRRWTRGYTRWGGQAGGGARQECRGGGASQVGELGVHLHIAGAVRQPHPLSFRHLIMCATLCETRQL